MVNGECAAKAGLVLGKLKAGYEFGARIWYIGQEDSSKSAQIILGSTEAKPREYIFFLQKQMGWLGLPLNPQLSRVKVGDKK